MRKLNLPAYDFRYRTDGGEVKVLDVYRKRYVKLTPEEEVTFPVTVKVTSSSSGLTKGPSGPVFSSV